VDISIIEGKSIKLKSKQAIFVVDPAIKMPKIASDAIILLDGYNDVDVSRVTDSRIIINGPGEYEVSGVKISGTKTSGGTLYKLLIDDMIIILGSAAEIKTEGFNNCQIAVVNTTNNFIESFVTTLEPKTSVLYGEKKIESARALGAESVTPVAKVTIAKDKLPEKMEVAVLG
jgi:hypothetical protein